MVNIALGSLLLATLLGASSTPLFETDSILDIELRGPFGNLLEDEANEPRPFQLTAAGETVPVNVNAGGKSRQQICSFPPLRLQFDARPASPTANSMGIFTGQELLRVVTHCRSGARAQANTIEEYLAYRILNLITDFSYRVRLLEVNYVTTAPTDKHFSKYAFAIESEYELAHRLGGQVLMVDGLPKGRLNEEQAARVYVFEYMIGNTDWSQVSAMDEGHCCHNGQLIGIDSEVFYIPYDFDITGLVNPRYARPDPTLSIKRVASRLYRGYCGPRAALSQALEHINSQREAIVNLYKQAPVLSAAERDRGISYLEGFFRKAQEPEKLLERFERLCLG